MPIWHRLHCEQALLFRAFNVDWFRDFREQVFECPVLLVGKAHPSPVEHSVREVIFDESINKYDPMGHFLCLHLRNKVLH